MCRSYRSIDLFIFFCQKKIILFCLLNRNVWKLLQVSDTDLEIIEATTGKSPSEDSGLGLTVPDIRNRYILILFLLVFF